METKMKLSEAIRLGAMLRPQAFGGLFKSTLTWRLQRVKTSCAMGAAIEAANIQVKRGTGRGMETLRGGYSTVGEVCDILMTPPEWNVVLEGQFFCPECGESHGGMAMIAHLNDKHRLTRERIAAWVATIESQDEAVSEPQQVRENIKKVAR